MCAHTCVSAVNFFWSPATSFCVTRQVSLEEGEILCTDFSELVVNFIGEISVLDQMVTELFGDVYRWVKRQKIVAKSGQSIQDRVSSGKGSPNASHNGSPPV